MRSAASLVFGTLILLAGCSREPECTANVGEAKGEVQLTGFACSDNVVRAIECVPDGTKGPRCTCIANSVRGNEFHMNVMGPSADTAIPIARENCGWKVRAR